MKFLTEFVKSTLVGGFFILLPLLLVAILLGEMLDVVVGLATPIADLFPEGTFEDVEAPVVVAVALILLASFVLGLAARLAFARRLGDWLERQTVGRLPLYQAIKSLTARFASLEEGGSFRPALVLGPNDQRELAFLMEELGNGFAAVMLPRAPTPMVGSIRVVPMAQVELLDVSLGDFTAAISHWGVGSRELINADAKV